MNCEFCNHIFKNISSLNYHKKNTKYCINIQNKFTKEDNEYICEYCDSKLTSKRNLINHKNICKNKLMLVEEENINYKETINKLNIEIASLKAKLEIYEKEHIKLKELKNTNKECESYIKHFAKLLDDCKISNTNCKLLLEYETKIEYYQDIIDTNKIMIAKYGEIDYENNDEKLLDGVILN